MIAAVTALVLAATPASRPSPGAAARDAVEERRQALAPEILSLGVKLRREIERHDVAAILARIPPGGLRCGDRVVPRERVARDLRNEASWIHGVLFGGAGFRAPPGTAQSLAALFEGSSEIAVAVSFEPDPRVGPEGRPCLEYRSKETATPAVPFCFEKRDGKWWLAESLYPCR